MTGSPRNRAIALGALFQCCELVRQLAWRGHCDSGPFETVVNSLFVMDPKDIDEIYGSIDALRPGLETLRAQLGDPPRERNVELTRYAISVLYLERRLQKDPAMLEALGKGLGTAHDQLEFFGPTHENMIARLGDLYQQTISQLGPRIIVQGEQTHLANPDNAARIRTLLLGAIRAAVLWRQAGGTRWRLIFGRKRILSETDALLQPA